MKGEVYDIFVLFSWVSVGYCERVCERNSQPPGTQTHSLTLANPASESTGPSSSLSSRLFWSSPFLIVAFLDRRLPRLLLYALLCWLPSSVHCSRTLNSLLFFWSRRKSRVQALCVSFAPKQTKEYFDWHSPIRTKTNATYRITVVLPGQSSSLNNLPHLQIFFD